MTSEQQIQWNTHACGPRCLLKLSELQGNPLSIDNFLSRFYNDYPQWKTQCGGTITSILIDLARKMNLCVHANAFRSFNKVCELLSQNKTRGILLFTDFNPEEKEDKYHCQLVLNCHKNLWHLWFPNQDGTDTDYQCTEDHIDQCKGHFLVLM